MSDQYMSILNCEQAYLAKYWPRRPVFWHDKCLCSLLSCCCCCYSSSSSYFSKSYQLPNNLNSHNSVSFKASSPKFCMVVYLHNTNRPYHAIIYYKIPNNTKYQMPNISNSNKSVICQARSLKFCMIVDLDNTNKLYHTISYHTTIYQVIPNTKYFKQS